MKHSELTQKLLCLSFFLLAFLPFNLFAEGTSTIAPSTADEAALFVGAGNTGTRGGDYGLFAWKDSDSKLYFNVQRSCEKIYIGFGKPRNDRSFADINPIYGGSGIEENLIFRILDPTGTPINNLSCFGNTTINGEVWQTLNSTTANITSRTAADNGPSQLGNAGGYNAFALDLSACGINLTGNYSIEFYTTNSNYDPNTSRSGFYIPYFDITVADCTNTGLTGRVWSNNWGIGIKRDGDGSFDRAFNGTLYVCSIEGFITKLDFNTQTNTRAEAGKNNDQRSGFRAGSFNISFNQQGPGNSGNIGLDRQSVPNQNSPNPQLPVFLNLPDESFCPAREIGKIKAAADFLTGCPSDRCINIAATQPGQFEIIIENANGNGILDQPSERRLIYIITESDKVSNPETLEYIYEACIPWDGKDGNGMLLLEAIITITGNYFQGLYHFPVYDAEFNDDGFIVETVRPALGLQKLYYDDTRITESSGTTEPKDGTNGCIGPCHRWTGEWENYTNDDDNYGNFNTINTWWFASSEAQDFTNSVGDLVDLDLTCPADFTGCASQSTDPTFTGQATLDTNDPECPKVVDYIDVVVIGDCGEKTIFRKWFAKYTSIPGTADTCVQKITLDAPELTNCPNDVVLDCDSDNTYSWQAPTISGNCGGTVIQTSGPTSGSSFPTGTTTISYEIENPCGDKQTCSFTVTVNGSDQLADLTLNCPADFVGCKDSSIDPSVTGEATVTYTNPVCPFIVDFKDNLIKNTCEQKVIERQWVVYFENDPKNKKTCTQTITLTATQLSNCPTDIVLDCDDGNIATWQAPTVSGDCDGTVIQTSGLTSGNVFPLGTTTVSYEIENACGASQKCSFTVTVLGGQIADLDITCPSDYQGCADDSTNPSATGKSTVTGGNDNCPYILSFDDTILDNGCGAKTIQRTWYVYFDSNPTERKTCTQTITLTAPTLTNCPTDVVLDCTDGNVYSWQAPTISGNCGGTVIQTNGLASGSPFPIGTTTITYKVGEGCSNQVCSFTVTVTGDSDATCPNDVVLDCEAEQNGAHHSWEPPTGSSCCNDCPTPGLDLADFVYMGTLNGHQYYCSKEKADWQTAQTMCEKEGGHLAVINSEEENQLLSNFLENQAAFIGLNDYRQEGNFEWVNNEPVTYTNWYPGQPDNYGNNQNVARLFPNGKWDDVYDFWKLEYIMEIPCATILQTVGPASGSLFSEGTTTVSYLIKDNCGNQETCDFQVTVNPCERELDYCEMWGTNDYHFWIRHIVLGNINKQSGRGNGYSDYTHLSTSIHPGSRQTIILSPGFRQYRYYLNWRVWIDYNRDGDFLDENEEVLTYKHYNVLKIGFTVPQNCSTGPARMRIAMKYGNPAQCCESFSYGEVEDYTINLLPASFEKQPINATGRTNSELEVTVLDDESKLPVKDFLIEESPQMKVFPNPVKDDLNLQITNIASANAQLKIYNHLGQVVHYETLTLKDSPNTTIPVGHLPNGMYLLSIESEGEKPLVQKFNKH